MNFTRCCNVDCGAYVESITDVIIKNDNSERTQSCIALGPSGNRQGSIICFGLETGRVVLRTTVKKIPWTDRLLKVDNQWGVKVKVAIMRSRIKFLNRNG